jgi:hypothetical protein
VRSYGCSGLLRRALKTSVRGSPDVGGGRGRCGKTAADCLTCRPIKTALKPWGTPLPGGLCRGWHGEGRGVQTGTQCHAPKGAQKTTKTRGVPTGRCGWRERQSGATVSRERSRIARDGPGGGSGATPCAGAQRARGSRPGWQSHAPEVASLERRGRHRAAGGLRAGGGQHMAGLGDPSTASRWRDDRRAHEGRHAFGTGSSGLGGTSSLVGSSPRRPASGCRFARQAPPSPRCNESHRWHHGRWLLSSPDTRSTTARRAR